MLTIKALRTSVEGKEILKGIDLEVDAGQVHVLMGPNGSGKSTLAQVIAGHPNYKVYPTPLKLRGAGSSPITFNSKDISKLTPDKRAKFGIFLAFQHPVEIPGVSVFNVLRKAKTSHLRGGIKTTSGKHLGDVSGKKRAVYSGLVAPDLGRAKELRQELVGHLSSLKLSEDFLSRSLNEGFSGGEKKRSEILQMMALAPKLVILDEIDSGLDVDGLKLIAKAIKQFTVHSPQSSVILITHYARILKYLKPDFVHILMDGKIIKSGKVKLARQIEEKGYQAFSHLSS